MKSYGKELILDLYGCDPTTFNRDSIEKWLDGLCELIDMDQEDLHFWDYEEDPEGKAEAPDHLLGTTAVQFITTSDIRIHALDKLKECYINIFSCKDFDVVDAWNFTSKWFGAKTVDHNVIEREKFTKAKT